MLPKMNRLKEEAEEIKIYYMRDNHTFSPLSLNLEEALSKIESEFAAGYTYGMVCSKSKNAPDPLHLTDASNLSIDKPKIAKFYAAFGL